MENKETYSIVIYELIPEECRIYVIPNSQIDSKLQDMLTLFHGHCINGDIDMSTKEVQDEVQLFCDVMEENSEYYSGNNPTYQGCIAQYRQNTEKEKQINFSSIIVTQIYQIGFYL